MWRNLNGPGKEEGKGHVSEAGCVDPDGSSEIWKIFVFHRLRCLQRKCGGKRKE